MLKAGSISMRNARRPVPGKNVIRGAIENRGLDTQGLVAVHGKNSVRRFDQG